jgi:REP element-mobilizing transposase RayT
MAGFCLSRIRVVSCARGDSGMRYDPNKHHRRSLRLRGYDYSRPGAYFVTICVHARECLFGDVREGDVWLNGAGEMVSTIWHGLPVHYPGADIDAFVVMPNHVHGIIILSPVCARPDTVGATPLGCPTVLGKATVLDGSAKGREGQARGPASTVSSSEVHSQARGAAPTVSSREILSLPDVVHRFKSLTTARYREGVARNGWPRFSDRLWQRNYYERIIRDDFGLDRIRRYIAQNPTKWGMDRQNRTRMTRTRKMRPRPTTRDLDRL